jgi:uncharacterized protein
MSRSLNNSDDILSAVYRKDVKTLESLAPSAVNAKDGDGRTALMHAILAEDADASIVRLLIDRQADVNASDNGEKWTALHFAARDQNEEIVRILLDAGAKVDSVDTFGNTPLWRSVMNSGLKLNTIKELVRRGANPYQKNERGIAPIDIARDTGQDDVVALFEDAA